MKYKYNKRQIFGKKLKIPKDILNKVYSCTLSFNEFIEYDLEDKIPISCITYNDRKVVEKFGIDKCKKLDWELLSSVNGSYNISKDILMSFDAQTENINANLYELVKNQIRPVDYSSQMKRIYSNRLFDITQEMDEDLKQIANDFNNGKTDITNIVKNWDLFKNKDLDFCLLNDRKNKNHITDNVLKEFMNDYGNLATLIMNNEDIYSFINNISKLTAEEKNKYMKTFTDKLLNNTNIEISNKEYMEIFKYSSLEKYLDGPIIEELKTLPENYIFNVPIPFSMLIKPNILRTINIFGLKNIVDFDNECGHFFTNNNFEMLELLNNQSFRSRMYPATNNEKLYSKNEFYEAMKNFILSNRSDESLNNKIANYRNITGEFRDKNPELFLSDQAPYSLQNAFYSKSITPKLLFEHPEYIKYIENKNVGSCFEYINVEFYDDKTNTYKCINLYEFLSDKMDFKDFIKFIIEYDGIFRFIYECNIPIFNIYLSKDNNIDQIEDKIMSIFKDLITRAEFSYSKNVAERIKDKYKAFFLDDTVPIELQNSFYKRKLTVEDFDENPKLFNFFDKTNIAYGFSKNMSWTIPLFNDLDNIKTANYNRIRVISEFSKINDDILKEYFKSYVINQGNNIDLDKIKYIAEVFERLSLSNSSEMFAFRRELATQILETDDPLESLSKIEDIFIKNNIPTVGKIYSCFEILHPDFRGFDFESSMISPVLKKSSTLNKKIIVFSDLIKSSFGSNNRSINAYLKNIEFGYNLYESIKTGKVQFNSLNEVEKQELVVFRNHLATLYNNTMKSKKENESFISSEDVLKDILTLSYKLSPNGTLDYNLADRVIRMFCGFAGIDTLNQAKEYIKSKINNANARNRKSSNSDMILEQGDFIKGIGDITYLKNILQNGSVSKEYLGSRADSDLTPLDTDISMIISSDGTISEKINATVASSYGPIWFVLKNDDRFITTRTDTETLEAKRDMSKMEVFYTSVNENKDHYGIRTGFASSEIDYIVVDSYETEVGLEIAMNGFYIPVADRNGKIIFTPKDYDELREKMSGLSYFGEQNYSFSENLVTEETELLAQQIEQSNYEVQVKKQKINNIIRKSLEELKLDLKTNIDGDLTEGTVELIDTGSTGRGTNKPGDGDFDFMMRIDKSILSNPSKLIILKQTILRNLGIENASLTSDGDFRLKNVQIDNDTSVDIDITFTQKTDNIAYSTDMALQDRLNTIYNLDPEKYKYVIANILLAKQVLKNAQAYKPDRGETPQGGLGGVGIENWILQNGGSFIDAAKNFLKAAEGKSFDEFKSTYQIWDFGDNHLAERKGFYPHDNFITRNMSEDGYDKMVNALKVYLKSLKVENTNKLSL